MIIINDLYIVQFGNKNMNIPYLRKQDKINTIPQEKIAVGNDPSV
jgi:hypothetical protein